MKAILMSIRPEWVAKILNGEKTIEIRKTKPKRKLPIDVYIWCTKPNNGLCALGRMFDDRVGRITYFVDKERDIKKYTDTGEVFNGKVVAKFTLRKVEEFIQGLNEAEYENLPNFALKDYDYYGLEDLMEKACLNDEEINEYAPDLSFYAWHISDLVIFDKPKELSEFHSSGKFDKVYRDLKNRLHQSDMTAYMTAEAESILKRPPQSWQYVEVEK